jgi:hypothetical protein
MKLNMDFAKLANSSVAYVYIGFTESVEDIRLNTLPIVLNPTAHLHAHLTTEVRQTFATPASTIWGVLTVSFVTSQAIISISI